MHNLNCIHCVLFCRVCAGTYIDVDNLELGDLLDLFTGSGGCPGDSGGPLMCPGESFDVSRCVL